MGKQLHSWLYEVRILYVQLNPPHMTNQKFFWGKLFVIIRSLLYQKCGMLCGQIKE